MGEIEEKALALVKGTLEGRISNLERKRNDHLRHGMGRKAVKTQVVIDELNDLLGKFSGDEPS